MTEFTKKIIALIKKIPKGKVATYSQLAKLANNPHAIRGVVWILHSQSSTKDLPWHRVVNAKGKISFPEMSEQWIKQKKLLEKDGIEFGDGLVIDMDEFQWKRE